LLSSNSTQPRTASRLFDWRDAVVIVLPSTIARWHRLGWRIFWRRECRAGRPTIPPELRSLIRRIAAENALWDVERIANELLAKLAIRVSPRTFGKYIPKSDRLVSTITNKGAAVGMTAGMDSVPPPRSFLTMIAAGWIPRHQLIVIEFLQAEPAADRAGLVPRPARFHLRPVP
jgi:hypothetical protein